MKGLRPGRAGTYLQSQVLRVFCPEAYLGAAVPTREAARIEGLYGDDRLCEVEPKLGLPRIHLQ